MQSIGINLAELQRRLQRMSALAGAALDPGVPAGSAHLSEWTDFAPNPGNLRAWSFVPEGLGVGAPLIVALHGCSQDAADYDRGAGWSQLAASVGAAVLFPEQRLSNNARACFNWFSPDDVSPHGGEAESIRAIVTAFVAARHLDAGRVYVTGLSAGAAMGAALMALYPDLFAAGALIAGLPFGCASNALEALQAMADGAQRFADLPRLEPGRKHWPRVAIWHGSADETVDPANADQLARQWTAAHGLAFEGGEIERENSAHTIWRDRWGRPAVERLIIQGLAHGAPIDARVAGEHPGRYMFDVGLASSWAIARSWGLLSSSQANALPSALYARQPFWMRALEDAQRGRAWLAAAARRVRGDAKSDDRKADDQIP